MENFSIIVVSFITGVLGPIAVLYVRYRLEKRKKKPDIVMDTLRVSELVDQKIEHIKDEFKADRVWISQFHNGGNFYPTGKSIAKFSIMYEVVSLGTPSVQTNFKNIPVNLFTKSINQLLVNDVISINDFKDDTIATYGLKYIAEESGCKSAYLFSIKTIEDKFIGVLSVEYTKEVVKLDMGSINNLQVHASSIGGVLISYLQY